MNDSCMATASLLSWRNLTNQLLVHPIQQVGQYSTYKHPRYIFLDLCPVLLPKVLLLITLEFLLTWKHSKNYTDTYSRHSHHEQEQHRHQQKQQAEGGVEEEEEEEEEAEMLCLLELLTLTIANINLDKYFYVS